MQRQFNWGNLLPVITLVMGILVLCCNESNRTKMLMHTPLKIMGGEVVGEPGVDTAPTRSIVAFTVDGHAFCAGTLIERDKILTAAHCFKDQLTGSVPDLDKIRVTWEYNLEGADSVGIRRVRRHPDYDRESSGSFRANDIAIVTTDEPIYAGKPLQPLATQEFLDSLIVDSTEVLVAGWGMTEYSSYTSSVLRQTMIYFQGSGDECGSSYDDRLICLFTHVNNVGACPGDSGGPAYAYDDSADQWVQIGVLSGGGDICALAEQPDFYTSVVAHEAYIDEELGEGVRFDTNGDSVADASAWIWEGPTTMLVDIETDLGAWFGPLDTGIPSRPLDWQLDWEGYANRNIDYRSTLTSGDFTGDGREDLKVDFSNYNMPVGDFSLSNLTTIFEGGSNIIKANHAAPKFGLPSADDRDGRFLMIGGRGYNTIDSPRMAMFFQQPVDEAGLTIHAYDIGMSDEFDREGTGDASTCMRLFVDPDLNGGDEETDVFFPDGPCPEVPGCIYEWDEALNSFGYNLSWLQVAASLDVPEAANATGKGYRLEVYLVPRNAPTGENRCDQNPSETPGNAANAFKIRANVPLAMGEHEFSFIAFDSEGEYSAPNGTPTASVDTNYPGFFTFAFRKSNPDMDTITFMEADADDLDHPDSPGIADGANSEIHYVVGPNKLQDATSGSGQVCYPKESISCNASNFIGEWGDHWNSPVRGKPSGNYDPTLNPQEISEQQLPYHDGTYPTFSAYTGYWTWLDVLAANNVHIWVPRGSPPHLDIVPGNGTRPSSTASRLPGFWALSEELEQHLPILLGGSSGWWTAVSDVVQAKDLLFGALSTNGDVWAQLQGMLLSMKLNIKRAKSFNEDLENGVLLGSDEFIGGLVRDADDVLAAGVDVETASYLLEMLRSACEGNVTYLSMPYPIDGGNDDDGDAIISNLDNCPTVYNPEQTDSDVNGIGDACEPNPHVDCILPLGNGKARAYFGYDNPTRIRRIKVGSKNKVFPGAVNQGQPETQLVDGKQRAFGVEFSSEERISWQIAGNTVTADINSPICDDEVITNINVSDRVALYANGFLRLADNVTMADWSVAVNAGTNQTEIGAGSVTGDIWSKAPVFLRSDSTVAGTVWSDEQPELQNGSRILEGHNFLSKNIDALVWMRSFSGLTSWHHVEPNTTLTLEPGSYGNAQIKGVLELSSGSYDFESLSFEPGSVLKLNQNEGPVRIHVASTVTFRGVVESTSGEAPLLTIACFGTGYNFLEAPVEAVVIALNGTLVLAASEFIGTYFAKNIEVRPGTNILYKSIL